MFVVVGKSSKKYYQYLFIQKHLNSFFFPKRRCSRSFLVHFCGGGGVKFLCSVIQLFFETLLKFYINFCALCFHKRFNFTNKIALYTFYFIVILITEINLELYYYWKFARNVVTAASSYCRIEIYSGIKLE